MPRLRRPHFAALLMAWPALSCLALEAPERKPLPVRSMAYVLQADSLAKSRAAAVKQLAGCDRDLIVLDGTYANDEPWTKADIAAIRAGKPGRTVMAYLSIGEAEDYREYWKRDWDADRNGAPDRAAPEWLVRANPDWPGNYLVKYWSPAWRKIVLAGVDEAIDRGFDGAYLDVIDAFEAYEFDARSKDWIDSHRPNPDTKQTYRQDMIALVTAIADHARQRAALFRIIPQNGSQLLRDANYAATIDAIGIEDLFTDNDQRQPPEHSTPILRDLLAFQKSGKPVMLIEYAKAEKFEKLARDGAKEHGLVLLLTDRELKTLGR